VIYHVYRDRDGVYCRSEAEHRSSGSPISVWSGPALGRSDALRQYYNHQPGSPRRHAGAEVPAHGTHSHSPDRRAAIPALGSR